MDGPEIDEKEEEEFEETGAEDDPLEMLDNKNKERKKEEAWKQSTGQYRI